MNTTNQDQHISSGTNTLSRDSNLNIIQEPPSLDGGDSLNRDGQFGVLQVLNFHLKLGIEALLDHESILKSHVIAGQWWTRNALQVPWNNFKNCTRDQINPAIILCGFLNLKPLIQLTWGHIWRSGFRYQNTERDYPGTKKSLLPQFWKKGAMIEDVQVSEKDQWLWRPDGADLCGPNDCAMFIRAMGSKLFYPTLWILDFFLILGSLSIWFSSRNNKDSVDDMQFLLLLAQAKQKFPTPFSYISRKVYFALRPKNYGNEEHIDKVTLNKFRLLEGNEIDDPVMGAIAWYFRPPNTMLLSGEDKGKYDSLEFIKLWRPIIAWLRN